VGTIGLPRQKARKRLCTATAAAALKETFGSDGQPGTYDDIEACDALFLFGHNMAATQTVLWSRVLDRVEGPDTPLVLSIHGRLRWPRSRGGPVGSTCRHCPARTKH